MVKKATQNHVDIKEIFLGLQEEMVTKLRHTRKNVKHAPTKGAITESSWRKILGEYLPKRYAVESAFIIDAKGNMSDQIDLVIFDRHFSPFLFHANDTYYIPAESVYAVFEIKQKCTKADLLYAAEKAASVRRLERTTATITHAGGKHTPVVPKEIIAGILALTSLGKKSSFPDSLVDTLKELPEALRLNLACVLERGTIDLTYSPDSLVEIKIFPEKETFIRFFLSLLSKLQAMGSVPAIDITAYGDLLSPSL